MDKSPLKLLLVEDDDSLREIYSTRLAAEGFSIFFAKDGEEALATAVKIRPDIIVSDVMMPKISGFDMLDILRQTPETANAKVIMMTALGSEADMERGNKLGTDRYLVKSQVTLEDLVNTVHEVARTIGAPQPGVAPTGANVSPEDQSKVATQINNLSTPATPAALQVPQVQPVAPAVAMPAPLTQPVAPNPSVAPQATASTPAPVAPQQPPVSL